MPSFYPSANMNMPIPVVGVDPGPNWALNINASLTVVDSHDHSVGKGVQITPAGLNINSNLSIQSQNIIDIRSARFYPQVAVNDPTDLGCLYVLGDDLYYRDVSGTEIQITLGGNVNSGSGSISGLVPPASASYVTAYDSFVWQSGVGIGANMDMRNAILRNNSSGSFGMTIKPPNAMLSDFTVTFPALPASTSYLTMTNTGNMGTVLPPTMKFQTFTSTGTFVVPANVTQVIVFGCGGGGGGGGYNAGYGGTGGCGAIGAVVPVTVIPGASMSVTIGTGGVGGTVGVLGTAGNASYFSYLNFRGAPGGQLNGATTGLDLIYSRGGAGTNISGTADGSPIPGVSGGQGGSAGVGRGGGGGAGAYGVGANGGSQNASGSDAVANTGAGGGGAGVGGTKGGNGGSGRITICWVE